MSPKPRNAESEVYVLDSYSLLAFLEWEKGAETVKALLRRAEKGECRVLMSLINLGEALYITERERSLKDAQEVLALIEQLPIELLEVTRETVLAAAHIKARYPLAYADAFAVAAAQALNAPILTGDPEFEAVKGEVELQWL